MNISLSIELGVISYNKFMVRFSGNGKNNHPYNILTRMYHGVSISCYPTYKSFLKIVSPLFKIVD
jgi:hypothetical protein